MIDGRDKEERKSNFLGRFGKRTIIMKQGIKGSTKYGRSARSTAGRRIICIEGIIQATMTNEIARGGQLRRSRGGEATGMIGKGGSSGIIQGREDRKASKGGGIDIIVIQGRTKSTLTQPDGGERYLDAHPFLVDGIPS